jgi:Ran-binding protein 1
MAKKAKQGNLEIEKVDDLKHIEGKIEEKAHEVKSGNKKKLERNKKIDDEIKVEETGKKEEKPEEKKEEEKQEKKQDDKKEEFPDVDIGFDVFAQQ